MMLKTDTFLSKPGLQLEEFLSKDFLPYLALCHSNLELANVMYLFLMASFKSETVLGYP